MRDGTSDRSNDKLDFGLFEPEDLLEVLECGGVGF